jgi:hypothetical protein
MDDHEAAGGLGRPEEQRLSVAPLVDVDVTHEDVLVQHLRLPLQSVTVHR